MLAFAVIGFLALAIIVIVGLTFSARSNGLRARAGVDGFWVSTRGLRAGSRVRYQCLVRSSRQSGTVLVEPGPDEIFVYTGNTPTNISLDLVAYGASTSYDDDDDGVISTGTGGSFSSSSDDTYTDGSGGSGGTGDYGSSSASAESSASNAGDGFPPAY